MKKQMVSLLLVIVMLASMLVACNGGVNPNAATTADPSASASASGYFSSISQSLTESSNALSNSLAGNTPDGSSSSDPIGGEPSDSSSSSSSDLGQMDAENLVITSGVQIATKNTYTDSIAPLQSAIAAVLGAQLNVVYPSYKDSMTIANEIVIGDIATFSKDTRPGIKRNTDYDTYGEWEIYVESGRVFINGGSTKAIEDAIQYFVATYVTGQTTIKVPLTLNYKSEMSAIDVTVSQLSNKFYLGGATMSAKGVVLTAVQDTVIFRVNAGGTVKLKFDSEGTATFRVYTARGADYKNINVTSGTSEVVLAENLSGDVVEFMLVKRTGTTACTLTAVNLVGELADPPSISDTATTTKGSGSTAMFKIIGRGYDCSYGLTCDYSGAGFDFNIFTPTGTDITAKFITTSGDTYFAVYVDGVKKTSSTGLGVKVPNVSYSAKDNPNARAEVTLVSGLEPGFHNIRIVRQGNLWHSFAALHEISFKGTMQSRPANKDKYIEVIGDSITCGYGVISGAPKSGNDANGKNAGDVIYCDVTQAYSFLLAEKLKADYSICGYSGWGLATANTITYGDTKAQNTAFDIYEAYQYRNHRRTVNAATTGNDHYFNTNPRKPDLIIVNLGTNDRSRINSNASTYKTLATNFINLLRAKNGANVPIIWAYGAMTTNTSAANEAAIIKGIKDAISAGGGSGAKLYYYQLAGNTAGGNGHPTAAHQKTMADALVKYIKDTGIAGFSN